MSSLKVSMPTLISPEHTAPTLKQEMLTESQNTSKTSLFLRGALEGD